MSGRGSPKVSHSASHRLESTKATRCVRTDRQRLAILRDIFNNRHTLFGHLAAQEDKHSIWKRIYSKSVANGFVYPEGKDYMFLRDTIWTNFKRKLKYKREKKRPLDCVDRFTAKILGHNKKRAARELVAMEEYEERGDSAYSGISESLTEASDREFDDGEYEEDMMDQIEGEQSFSDDDTALDLWYGANGGGTRTNSRNPYNRNDPEGISVWNRLYGNGQTNETARQGSSGDPELTSLRRRKLELEIQNLELENYRHSLEIVKILGPSYSLETPWPECLQLKQTVVAKQEVGVSTSTQSSRVAQPNFVPSGSGPIVVVRRAQ